jgi:Spy/CpxP family protein refolding chaperone
MNTVAQGSAPRGLATGFPAGQRPHRVRRAPRSPSLLLCVLGAILVPVALPAQQPERPRAGEISREDMMQRAVREWERRVARELGLTSDQMQAVQGVMAEFRPLRYELMQERRELREQIRAERRAGLDSVEARSILEKSRALRERDMALQEREEVRLLEILTPPQLVRLQALREELGDQIRRLDQRTRPRPRDPGPPELDGGTMGQGSHPHGRLSRSHRN